MQLDLSFAKKTKLREEWDVIIIGGGPAGLSAALYVARARLNVLVIDKNLIPGGTIALTSLVEDYPGIKSIKGEEFGRLLKEHAELFGANFLFGEEVVELKKEDNLFFVKTSTSKLFKAKAVIIATGSSYKKLGVPGEEKFYGKGVSNCAVCDGPFFKDKRVVVVGGGNSALDEALYLTKFAKEVYIVHRRDQLRADRILQERAFSNPKINFIFNTEVKEIKGDENVEGVVLWNKKENKEYFFETDGVFVFIGLKPNSQLVEGLVELDEKGYIKTNEFMETSLKGLYAIGDVRTTPFKQAIVAAGEGAIAGHYAAKFVEEAI